MTEATAPTRQVTVAEAAALLGVSVDTIKRRVRSGALHSSHTAQGRVLVDVPGEEAAPQPPPSAPQDAPHLHRNDDLLAAVTADRDWLKVRVERAESEREQLRILLSNAQQSLVRALQAAPQPARRAETPPVAQPEPKPAIVPIVAPVSLWRRWWLAGLTVAGFVAVMPLLAWPR